MSSSMSGNNTNKGKGDKSGSEDSQGERIANLPDYDKKTKMNIKKLKKLGIFKRLAIEPGDFVQYSAEVRDAIVRKYIATDIHPAQILNLMKKSDKVYSQIINSENDAEYLKIGKDFVEDVSYPGAPTADRLRAKWKKIHITKVKIKNKNQDSDDEAGMDHEELLAKRMKQLNSNNKLTKEEAKKILIEMLEKRLKKGLNENFNSEDEDGGGVMT